MDSKVSPEQAKRIGEYIRLLRKQGGRDRFHQRELSIHDLSRLADVKYQYISRIENGQWKRVGGEIWRRLAKALNTTSDDLMNVGSRETEIVDMEAVRIPLIDEVGGFVYVSQREMQRIGGKRVMAIRSKVNVSSEISAGDVAILEVDTEFVNDALYLVYVHGEYLIRKVHREGNALVLYGMDIARTIPAEDARIEGMIIGVLKGYRDLRPGQTAIPL
jgi:transcriptional regulator with XRE-family HTH domain